MQKFVHFSDLACTLGSLGHNQTPTAKNTISASNANGTETLLVQHVFW